MQNNSQILDNLKQIIKQKGLKYTKQREIIFETILNSDIHLNADDLNLIISKNYPNEKVGIATIYRALAFLEDTGLISSITLSKDGKKFESNAKKHHDHLICTKCNKIVEFLDTSIEKRQDIIAKNNGFKLISHTMYLYGICKTCQDES
jgi:Fur family ferric uptake transcriptional regulator